MIEIYDRAYYREQERVSRALAIAAPTAALRQLYEARAEHFAELARNAAPARAT